MQNNTDNQVNAGFFVRLAAYLIDTLIVGVALLIVELPFTISSWVSPDNIVVRDFIFEYSISDIVLYVLRVLYFIILTYRTGATIGKRLLHIRVVSAEDRELTLWEVIYRETVGRFLSALIINVGYFMVIVHGEKRGLHDLMADTKVVYCHKKEVIVETPIEYQEITRAYTPVSYGAPQVSGESQVDCTAQVDREAVAENEVPVDCEASTDYDAPTYGVEPMESETAVDTEESVEIGTPAECEIPAESETLENI